MSARRVHVVRNPAAGAQGTSERVLQEHVLPLLQSADVEAEVHVTTSVGDATSIARRLLEERRAKGAQSHAEREEALDVVLLGGDGTTSEFVNGLYTPPALQGQHNQTMAAGDNDDVSASQWIAPAVPVRLVIVPTGTSNALYAALYPPELYADSSDGSSGQEEGDGWRLRSLSSYINADPSNTTQQSVSLLPLTLSAVQFSGVDKTSAASEHASSQSKHSFALSHIVTSHALHACILRDSEALRAEHPSIARFKIAAAQNATVWHRGLIKLLPARKSGRVGLYDPRSKAFKEVQEKERDVQGPFSYVAALSTDRLEPAFIPAPFGSLLPDKYSVDEAHLARKPDELDLLILRPLRSPSVRAASQKAQEEAGAVFAKTTLTELTAAMYTRGRHVELTYPIETATDAKLEEAGRGDVVFEYYRVGGYEWIPAADDSNAAIVCVDGDVSHAIKTRVEVLPSTSDGSGQVHLWR